MVVVVVVVVAGGNTKILCNDKQDGNRGGVQKSRDVFWWLDVVARRRWRRAVAVPVGDGEGGERAQGLVS